ncbi:BTAD domain-containing putative transcriptional regulator [Kitasatospora sp. NPDC093102]|uniref:AfsR/SARP family transcriptional regulator n=1 Tax=Kitasatospora sp. NPDC093102 TaxID=3155069 RepID=UPI003424741F
MRIQLLGPVELVGPDGRTVELGGAKRRGVLALLALDLGRTVSIDRFYELLWEADPPAQARAALQGHIAALRKLLAGSPFTLRTEAPGYRLDGDPEAVDEKRFAALAARAAVADDTEGAALLRGALDLWADEPLRGLPGTALVREFVEQLNDHRVRVLESWAERELRLGNGPVAIPSLEQSIRVYTLREPTIALLMRCLHQAGRSGDALDVYQDTKARLDDELGIAPGPLLHQAFGEIRGARTPEPSDPALTPAPAGAASRPAAVRPGPAVPGALRCLPRQPAGFVGRDAEFAWLERECGPERVGSGLAVVVGPAGAGKTAVVVRWAQQASSGFADGRLFADLRGFDPSGPANPGQILGDFLRALGEPESGIPEDRAARAELYRNRTRDRRLLVVLDNVRSSEDIADLLPADPRCATVVTSRRTLEDLVVTEGAAMLRLEALPEGDAWALLERMLTPARVAAEQQATRRLIALCDHLPLALRIAAARLAARPGWTVADLVTELEDERTRLLALDTEGAVSVHSALALTWRHLPSEAARLLGLLAAHPGTEVDTPAAAALLESEIPAARRALGTLAAYHLLVESAPGRYGRHDLVRLFGARLLAERGDGAHAEATARLLDYYLAASRAAVACLEPFAHSPGPLSDSAPALPSTPDVRSALAWFRREEPTLRGLVALAADTGEPERAWRLAKQAHYLYLGAGQLTDRLSCLRDGLRAARLTGERSPLALMETLTASALTWIGRSEEALSLVTQAVERTGPSDGEAHILALTTLAMIHGMRGDLARAHEQSDAVLRLIRETGLREHEAAVLSNASALKGMAGDAAGALHYAREALRLLADHPGASFQLSAMHNEAQAIQILHPEAAEDAWTTVLHRCRDAGNVHMQALTERQLADFLARSGRPADAAEHLRAAIELYTQRGDVGLVDQLTARLGELTH